MTPIGTVVHLQIQTSSLKKGVRPLRVYDPSPLLPVPRLRLAPEGAVGLAEDGSEHPDVHHAAHPHTKRARGREVSFGFTSHYGSMRERYGEKIHPGCAGENVLLETGRAWRLDDFAAGLALRSARTGALVRLAEVTVAAPCVEFSRFSLGDRHASSRELKPVLQFLDHGMRGYCCTPSGEGIVEIGDTLVTLDEP